MSGKRYTEEFKIEAVKQESERGHPVAEVASRLGVTTHRLYQWIKKYSVSAPERAAAQDQQAELRRLKAELKRLTDIARQTQQTIYRVKHGLLDSYLCQQLKNPSVKMRFA